VSEKVNQTINAPVGGHVAGGDVHVSNHTHSHQHTHTHNHNLYAHGPVYLQTTVVQQPPPFALQAPPAPPARSSVRAKAGHEITPAQKGLLALMRPLPKLQRISVLDWMRCEFGTALVMDLDPGQLQRTRTHVLFFNREKP
jgi:hypothetical protein